VIVEIMDLSSLEAEVALPERYFEGVSPGAPVPIEVGSVAMQVNGEGGAVNPKIDPQTRTFLIKVRVDNQDGRLKAGLFCSGLLSLPSVQGAVAVPSAAVLNDEGRTFVWVAESGMVKKRVIQIGAAADGFVEVTGGLRNGRTLGAPVVLTVANRDWKNWSEVMDPWQVRAEAASQRAVTRPRPGHADFSGGAATDQLDDMRNVLERASARETAARVAAGAVCCQLLERFGIETRSGVLQVGPHVVHHGPPDWQLLAGVRHDSPLVTPRPDDEQALVDAVRAARSAGDTMGGVVGAVVRGLPPGLGSHTHWDRKLDGRICQALVSIHSVKAAAIGAGIEVAGTMGSEAHDPIVPSDRGLDRTSNRAGGLEGGVTNGADLVVRAYFKPISTLRQGLPSVDLATGEAGANVWERSDVTAIGAAPVIVEALLALVLAVALL
jgi:chorismate synthase